MVKKRRHHRISGWHLVAGGCVAFAFGTSVATATTKLRVASLANAVRQMYGDHFGRYFYWRYSSI